MRRGVMGNKAFSVFVIVIIFVNLASLSVWWKNKKSDNLTHSHSHLTSTYLQYGNKAPSFIFSTTSGRVVNSDSLKGKFLLLKFFDPEDDRHWEIISYTNLLLKSYQNKGVESIAIAKSSPSNQEDLITSLTLPIVVDDSGLSIHELFHLKDCCGATLLIDPDGIIRFITPYIASSRLTKQIVESQMERINSNGSYQ
jgi:peroxiredoxin